MRVQFINISIIIPCLNEAQNITSCLDSIPIDPRIEIILVDGGSHDQTPRISKTYAESRHLANQSFHLLSSKAGRATQMNVGAVHAQGELLLFLHADSFLPDNALEQLSAFLQNNVKDNQKCIWGRFDVCLNNPGFIYRVIETLINERSAFFHMATGDQGIFVLSAQFKKVKGFPNIPLMEDLALSRILKKISPSLRIRSKIITSSRRWEKNGVIKTILLMWGLRAAYFIGVSPERLHAIYYGK